MLPIRISNAEIVGRYYEEHNETFENDCLTEKELKNLPDEIVICWGKLPKNIKNKNNNIENLEKLLKGDHLCILELPVTNQKMILALY